MAARKVRKNYRLSAEAVAIIEAIAELREWTDTGVIEHALGDYGRRILGRRMADLVAVRLRAGPGRDRPPMRG
jgi:hypothetical protein